MFRIMTDEEIERYRKAAVERIKEREDIQSFLNTTKKMTDVMPKTMGGTGSYQVPYPDNIFRQQQLMADRQRQQQLMQLPQTMAQQWTTEQRKGLEADRRAEDIRRGLGMPTLPSQEPSRIQQLGPQGLQDMARQTMTREAFRDKYGVDRLPGTTIRAKEPPTIRGAIGKSLRDWIAPSPSTFAERFRDTTGAALYGAANTVLGKPLSWAADQIMFERNPRAQYGPDGTHKYPTGWSAETDAMQRGASREEISQARVQDEQAQRRGIFRQPPDWEPSRMFQTAETVGNVAGEISKMVFASKLAPKLIPSTTNKIVNYLGTKATTGAILGALESTNPSDRLQDLGRNIATRVSFMLGGDLTGKAIGAGVGKLIQQNPNAILQLGKQLAEGVGFGGGGYTASTGMDRLLGGDAQFTGEGLGQSMAMGAGFKSIGAFPKLAKAGIQKGKQMKRDIDEFPHVKMTPTEKVGVKFRTSLDDVKPKTDTGRTTRHKLLKEIEEQYKGKQKPLSRVPKVRPKPKTKMPERPVPEKAKSTEKAIKTFRDKEFNRKYRLDEDLSKLPVAKRNQEQSKIIRKISNDIGEVVAKKHNTTDIKKIAEAYVKKYKLPKEIKIVKNLKDPRRVARISDIKIDKNGNILNKEVVLQINAKLNKYEQIGALRHEIQHYIDAVNSKGIFKPTVGGKVIGTPKTAAEYYKQFTKGHHKDFEWFEVDYLRNALKKELQGQKPVTKVETLPEPKVVAKTNPVTGTKTKLETKVEQPKYTTDQLKQLEKAKAEYNSELTRAKPFDTEMATKIKKGAGMKYSAEKRRIIQGDSLEKVEGGLTAKELAAKIAKEKKNYIGKKVKVDGKDAEVVGNPFGRVKVKFKDGTTKVVDKEKLLSPEKRMDKRIEETKKDIQEQKEIKKRQEEGDFFENLGKETQPKEYKMSDSVKTEINKIKKEFIPKLTLKEKERYLKELIKESDEILNAKIKELSTGFQKGKEMGKIIRDEHGKFIKREPIISKNDKWYREYRDKYNKVPTKEEFKQIADKHLREGFEDDAGWIKQDDEYVYYKKLIETLLKDIEKTKAQPVKTIAPKPTETTKPKAKETHQMTRNEYVKTPGLKHKETKSSPEITFDEFKQKKGIKLPGYDILFAESLGKGQYMSKAAAGKLKSARKKLALHDQLFSEYEDAIKSGEIKTITKEIVSDVNVNTKQGAARARLQHKDAVRKAISEGKQVPEEVLKDYPDLKAKIKSELPKPPAQTKTIPEKDARISRFGGKTVHESPMTSKKLKEILPKSEYEKSNMKKDYERAIDAVKRNPSKIHADLNKKIADKKPSINREDVFNAQVLARKLENEGRFDEAANLINGLSLKLTEAGKTVQAASLWDRMTPEGRFVAYQKRLDSVKDIMREQHKPIEKRSSKATKINNIEKELESLRQKNKRLENEINTLKKSKQPGAKEKLKKAEQELKHNFELYAETEAKLPGKYKNLTLTDEEKATILKRTKEINAMPDGYAKKEANAILDAAISSKIEKGFWDKVATTQVIAQLLNPRTLVKNITGNTGQFGLDNIADVVGTTIDKLLSPITKRREIFLPDIKKQVKEGLMEGKVVGKEIKLGIDTQVTDKYGLPQGTTFSKPKEAWHTKEKGILGKSRQTVSKIMAPFEKALNYGMRMPDRVFHKAALERELRKEVLSEFYSKHKRMPSKVEKAKLLRDLDVDEVTDRVTFEALDRALHNANKSVYKDQNAFSNMSVSIKKGLNKLTKRWTGTEAFGPGNFINNYPRIPANTLVRAVEFSPINALRGITKLAYNLSTGKAKQPSFDQKGTVEAIAKGLTGTPIFLIGGLLAKTGIIRTYDPRRSKETEFEEATGMDEFSLNVSALRRYVLNGYDAKFAKVQNDDYIMRYNWLQPLSEQATVGAEIHRRRTEKEKEKTSSLDMLGVIAVSMQANIDSLGHQSMFRNIRDFFSRGEYADGLKSVAKGVPASFVPTVVNIARQQIDPKRRRITEPEGTEDKDIKESINLIMGRIPGLSKRLPENVDVFGEPKTIRGKGNVVKDLINIFTPATTKRAKVTRETDILRDLFERTGSSDVLPRQAARQYTFEDPDTGEKIQYKLTPREQAELQKYIGKKAMEELRQLKPNINSMSDEDKIAEIKWIYNYIGQEAKEWMYEKWERNLKR